MARIIGRILNIVIFYFQKYITIYKISIYRNILKIEIYFYIQYISYTSTYNMRYPYIYQKFPRSFHNTSTSPRPSHKNQIIQSLYHIISWNNIYPLYTRLSQIFPRRKQIKYSAKIFNIILQNRRKNYYIVYIRSSVFVILAQQTINLTLNIR